MKTTKFKNKVIEIAIPIITATSTIASNFVSVVTTTTTNTITATIANNVIPIITTATITGTVVYADSNSNSGSSVDSGNYIIIGSQTPQTSQSYSVSISGGNTTYQTYPPGHHTNIFKNYDSDSHQWAIEHQKLTDLGNMPFQVGQQFYNLYLSMSDLAQTFMGLLSVRNLTGIALAGALYTLGTYAPVLKEAMVGADNMAKQMTMYTNEALNTVQGVINHLHSAQEAVQSCLNYTLSLSSHISGLSNADLVRYFGEHGQRAFEQAQSSCLKGESIVEALGGHKHLINKYLDKFNPRTSMNDEINQQEQAGLMYEGSNSNLDASDTISNTASNLMSLFNPQLVAEDMLIASQPKAQYNKNVGDIVPQFVYIVLPNGSKLLVSIASFDEVIKDIVKEQMYYTLSSMSPYIQASVSNTVYSHSYYTQHIQPNFNAYFDKYVKPIHNALNLSGNDFYVDWLATFDAIRTYNYALQHGTLPPPYNNIRVGANTTNSYRITLRQAGKRMAKLYTAEFEKEVLHYLRQDALQNEVKYMIEKKMNAKPPAPTPANQQNQSPPPPTKA